MLDSLVRILFIGNSFTTRNDLPGMLAEMAGEQGVTVEFEVMSAGGASLRRHLNAGAADRIRDDKWDYVVLQEQSTLPIKNSNRFWENVREFVPTIEDARARLVLYMTWARKNEPQNQALLTDAYDGIGKELGAIVVPAGSAWKLMLANIGGPALHDKDGSHPTLAGTYLAACTFYLALFGDDLVNIRSDALSNDDQKQMQSFAKAAQS